MFYKEFDKNGNLLHDSDLYQSDVNHQPVMPVINPQPVPPSIQVVVNNVEPLKDQANPITKA